MTQIDNDNFLLYTDYKFLDIKEITLDLGDLSEIEMWLDGFLDKSIKHLYNQKNNPNYSSGTDSRSGSNSTSDNEHRRHTPRTDDKRVSIWSFL